MQYWSHILLTFAMANATPILAQSPRVVTDIAPIHSLVSAVMDGVGTPSVLLKPNASVHQSTLKPSQAAQLQKADAVIVLGDALTPWLQKPIQTLAPNALLLTLMDLEKTHVLNSRGESVFDDHDDKGHDDHEHGAVDPHAWLALENAHIWTDEIAQFLATMDPENAAQFYDNAASYRLMLTKLETTLEEQRTRLKDLTFLAYHDSFQYIEHEVGLRIVGAISRSDASKPSVKRIQDLGDAYREAGIDCIIVEPGFNPKLLNAIGDIAPDRIIKIDILGAQYPFGTMLYTNMITNLFAQLATCENAD